MTTDTPSLPIIDISPYLSSSKPGARQETAAKLNDACIQRGFFYLTGHGIPVDTSDRVLDLARTFFTQSSDDEKAVIKRLDPPEGDGARGYQKIGENVTSGKRDWHEAVDLYQELDTSKNRGSKFPYGKNLWPRRPEELKTVYEEYIEDVKRVGTAVVRAMGDALGLDDSDPDEGPDVFVEATRRSFWVMRMIGYPGLPWADANGLSGDADQYSCGAHTGAW